MTVYALAALVVILAGLARGFSGFGSALIMSPALSVLFGPPVAIATMALIEVPAIVQLLPQVLRHAERHSVVPLGLAAAMTVPLGATVLVRLDEALMRRAIGLFVLTFVVVLALGWRYRGAVRLPVTLGVGASSGLLSGAMGIPGPPIVLFYLSGPATAMTARGSIMGFFIFTNTAAIVSYAFYDLYTGPVLWRAAGLAPAYVAGIWLGSCLYGRVSETAFRRVALVLLVGVAVAAIVN